MKVRITPPHDSTVVIKRNKLIWLLVVSWLAAFVSVAKADFDDGRTALAQGDYDTAFKEFKPLAEQGDALAQYSLGLMYRNGYGVPRNYGEAANWWRKAAEQGYAIAQNNPGLMFDDGYGVPQDYKEAIKWYRKAAEQGEALFFFPCLFSVFDARHSPSRTS